MNSYVILHTKRFTLDGYELVPLRKKDIHPIRRWRNAQIDVLRQNRLLTVAQQERYYAKEIAPTFKQHQPRQVLFSFLKDDQAIGYGGLTNLEWDHRRAEISFLVDTKISDHQNRYVEAFSKFLTLVKEIAFHELHLNRLFTETYAFRDLHIQALESAGFVREGRLLQHVFIKQEFCDSLIHGILSGALNGDAV